MPLPSTTVVHQGVQSIIHNKSNWSINSANELQEETSFHKEIVKISNTNQEVQKATKLSTRNLPDGLNLLSPTICKNYDEWYLYNKPLTANKECQTDCLIHFNNNDQNSMNKNNINLCTHISPRDNIRDVQFKTNDNQIINDSKDRQLDHIDAVITESRTAPEFLQANKNTNFEKRNGAIHELHELNNNVDKNKPTIEEKSSSEDEDEDDSCCIDCLSISLRISDCVIS